VIRRKALHSAYPAVLGLVAGVLVTGLVLPFVVGEEEGTTTAVGGAALAAGDAAGSEGGGGAGGDDAASTDGGGSGGATGGATAAPDGAAAGGGTAGGGATSGGGSVALAATDRGVTATAVRLGIVTADLRTANAIGLAPDNYEIESQQRAYRTFVEDLNAKGGINGRRVELVFQTVDPLDDDAPRAACLSLVRDSQVFAVVSLNSMATTGSLCVTKEGATPLISGTSMPVSVFRESGGRLITNMASIERMMANWVAELDRTGALKGRKIGVLASEDDAAADKQAADAVVAELGRAGHAVAHRSRLSADLQTGTGQLPVEVQRMRQAGVDLILLPVNFLYATQFAQAASGQGYRPRYAVSDHQGLYSDELVQNMPPDFDGAISFTSYRINEKAGGLPEPEVERDCRERYNRRADGPDFAYGDSTPLQRACGQIGIFAAAAGAAGPQLTRDRFLAGLAGLGRVPLTQVLGGSFGPGKTDYADDLRPMTWSSGCRCWRIAGPPTRGRT
jgi:hypothetical protein